jgi:hypothetical protein
MKTPILALCLSLTGLLCAQQKVTISRAEQEAFLLNAKVINTKSSKNGITGTIRATLSDGVLTHDAQIQTIDEHKTVFQGTNGTEMNFRDSYKYNIAGYKLDKMLELNMIPVSVGRKYEGKNGAFTWWIDDVMMEEKERMAKKLQAPDPEEWNSQMYFVRVFDQLIQNTDRNLGNLLICKDWRIWMIDHTRAFRVFKEIKEPKALTKIDKEFLAKLKTLSEPVILKELSRELTKEEIKAMMARRDQIVGFFERAGEAALYYSQRRPN